MAPLPVCQTTVPIDTLRTHIPSSPLACISSTRAEGGRKGRQRQRLPPEDSTRGCCQNHYPTKPYERTNHAVDDNKETTPTKQPVPPAPPPKRTIMGRFGFWKNSNIFFQSSLDDDPEEQRHRQEQERRNHGDGDSMATIDDRPQRTTVVYGTIQQEHDQHQQQHQQPQGSERGIQQRLLVGDEPRQVQWTGIIRPMVPSPQHRRMSRSSSSSDDDGSSSTTQQQQQQQELPSLTAAFRSIENRTIVFNCVFYLIIYMTIAVVAYSFVLEQWTIIDSLYFAVATL